MRISLAETRVFVVLLALGLAPASACDGTGEAGADGEISPFAARSERALPRFEGATLDGDPLDTSVFRRKRGVVFLFSERDQGADDLAEMIARLEADSTSANLAFVGISRDREAEHGRAFARRHGLDFPILHDPSGAISRKLRAAEPKAAVIVVDGEGFMILDYAGVQPDVGLEVYEQATRDTLRLESAADAVAVHYGVRPEAPGFAVTNIEGGELSLSDLERKVVVLVFFLHTCPHCHDTIRFLTDQKQKLGRDDLVIVPISVQNKPDALKKMRDSLELDVPIYLDPEGSAQKAYAHTSAVPDTVILDREHRVVARHSGMAPRIQALMDMSIRQALGVENPILLVRDGYSGAEACSICHASQHETWALTNHGYAFDTLVEHGENRDPECLPCHTVGWDEPGGYSGEHPEAYLEGVQCESCHGRGGPHQSPDFLAKGFESVCLSCHTPEHSLRFDFAKRLPLVSHSANLQFTGLSLEDRRKLLARRDKRERELFEPAEYMGSQSCQSCHASEYEIWSRSAHARAFATLEASHEQANTDCQHCHTTGFEQRGGFPAGDGSFEHVGCESCHGPGGSHVAESARKDGTILGLADKCDSCVVLQICGSCHDDANDPNFEFEVLDKIDLIRHGYGDRAAASALE